MEAKRPIRPETGFVLRTQCGRGHVIVFVMLILISLSILLHLAALACLLIILKRRPEPAGKEILEPVLREELGKARSDAERDARLLRQEVAEVNNTNVSALTTLLLEQFNQLRVNNDEFLKKLQEGITGEQKVGFVHLTELLDKIGEAQGKRFEDFETHLKNLTESDAEQIKGLRESNDEFLKQLREGITGEQKVGFVHLTELLDKIGEAQGKRFEDFETHLKNLIESNENHIGTLGEAVGKNLKEMRESNEQKLEQMRKTVDEKLQGTLEKRLGESFKLVSEQLAEVHKGLGDMQKLATNVGSLKQVLTNVKLRGTWGEVQLGALLEQVLTPQQYERNVKPNPYSNEMVEYAIKLPGPDDHPQSAVWLPIDSKFPQEDYMRLLDASESGDKETERRALSDLAKTVENAATDIRNKYLAPPHTTDFGLLFLPTEGLYAEVVRNQKLLDLLQQGQRVIPAGPTTLAAILNSLQMGFQTLAIQKRSSEVWDVLSAVKTEFGKFGNTLDKVKRHLDRASRTVEDTGVRTRAMERKLREVEELPADADSAKLLGLPPANQQPLISSTGGTRSVAESPGDDD